MRDTQRNVIIAVILITIGTVAAWAADQNYRSQIGRLVGVLGQVVAWALICILWHFSLVPTQQVLVIVYLWLGAVIAVGIRLITRR